jgi:hypothetical protein
MTQKEYYLNAIIENLKTKIGDLEFKGIDKSSYELRQLYYAIWVASGGILGSYDKEIEDSYDE